MGGDLTDERAVDLQRVQRGMLQVAERGVSRAEVVNREVKPHGTERVQGFGALLVVVHQYAFGQLQTEVSGLEPAELQGTADGVGEPAFQLAAGEIDSDPDTRKSSVLPGTVLGAGSLENPLSHGYNEAVLLGYGDELRWQEKPELRMPPAQQSLGSDHRPGVGIDDGLVVHLELVS